ncbi:putative reverse transcriptase domain-containing protein [Tanacetum coccineum]|uniref:Reverse transcriptase domain-containing protein n=1 Tax=Tanacetum coccineum TaxID=301880 RepID=A0ABQ5ITQ2_9ASTR
MDDLPVVELNQPDVVPVILEPALVDENEEPGEEEEFEDKEEFEEEEPQEEEDDIEVEDTIEPDDETVPASVHEVGESPTATFLREDGDRLLPGYMRRDIDSLFGRIASLSRRPCGRETVHALVEKKGNAKDEYYGKIILDLGNEVRSIVEEGVAAIENMVRKLGNAEERAECKKLKKIMPPKSAPLTQATVRRMIKESVNANIAAERARQANDGNNARKIWTTRKMEMTFGISECAEDKKVKFATATLRGPALTWWDSKVAILGLDVANQIGWNEMKKLMTAEFYPTEELQRMENELWNLKVKEYNMVAYTQRFNELALMCTRTVKPESVKINAYIRGLSDNIKGEVTSSKPTKLNEDVRMAHKLMEQKLQARNERILKGNKQKWENFQSGNSSGKRNHKDNSRQSSQNNQKQWNARAMTTALNEGKVSSGSLPVCERCFTLHVGECTIKCHKCGKIRHKVRYCKEKNVATGANAQPIWTCYDCGEQGHTRNQCPKKVKKEEVGEARGRAYAIKDARSP